MVLDVQDPAAPLVTASLDLPGSCRSLALQDSMAYVGCGAGGVHEVAVGAPGGPRLIDTLWLGGPVSAVKATRWRLVAAGLFNRRVNVYDLGHGTSPVLAASYKTAEHPVHLMVLGSVIHVSEDGGRGWSRCASGRRCGFGDEVEVLELDEQAGALDLVGSYDGASGALPYAAFWRDLAVVPRPGGIDVLQATVVP